MPRPRPLRRLAAAALTATTALVGVPALVGTARADHVIHQVQPAAAQTNSSVQVTISGSGFQPLTDGVVLRPVGGGTPIEGDVIEAESGASALKVAFDLATSPPAAPRAYDVVVTQGQPGLSDDDPPQPVVVSEDAVCGGCFTIASPAPSVTGVAKNGSTLGALRITGTNFAAGAVVEFYFPGTNTLDTALTFSSNPTSATEITGTYTPGPSATAGPRDVRVRNTDSQSATCASCLNQPRVLGSSPASRGQAAQNQTIQLAGQSYASGSSVFVGGDSTNSSGITLDSTTVTSSLVTLVMDLSSTASTGAKDVVVVGPDGGYTKHVGMFTVTNRPTISGISPSSRGQGATSQDIAITGADFNAPTFVFNPADGIALEQTTVSGPTAATLRVTVSPGAATTSRTITVTNGDAGTSTSSSTFTVNAGPTVTSVSPSSRPRGFLGNVVITGTGFRSGQSVPNFGSGITVVGTPNVTSTAITATIQIANDAAGGMRGVEVTNVDDAGRGVCAAPGCFSIDTAVVTPAAGSNNGPLTLTISGNTFGPDAVVQLAPDGRPAYQPVITASNVVLNPNGTLSATFDLTKAAPMAYDLAVSGGSNAASCAACFTVVGGAPTFASISPNSRGEGADDAVITVNGGNFANGSTVSFVRLNEQDQVVADDRITVVPGSLETLSATQLRFEIDIDEASSEGGPSRVVISNTDGSSVTCSVTGCFTINPGPTVSEPDPVPARGQGGTGNVTYTGMDVEDGVTLTFSGTGVTAGPATVAEGETPLDDVVTAPVTVAPGAATGARDVTFLNPDGGRYVCTGCFTVTPAPSVTGVTPAKAARATFVDVTISGTGFATPTPTVSAGPGITVSNVARPSGSSITARFTVTPGADLGQRSVTVTNGDGGTGTLAGAFTVSTVPGAPTGVTATRGDTQATVSWTAPADNGGDALTGYTVTSSPGGVAVNTTEPTATVTGLVNGVSYTFTVVARNAAGGGAASAPSNAVVPAGVPAAPTGVTGTPGNGTVDVSWTAPSPNGDPITGYTVTASPGGATRQASGTSVLFDGLSNGTAYTFTVVATNGIGNSAASAPSGSLTPFTVPDAPTAVSATPGAGAAQVTWTAPGFDGGSPITGYTVTASPGGATESVSGTTATVDGLSNGTAYTFTVVATNAAGNGAASLPSAEVVPAAVPDAPTGVTATRGNGSATVSWTAPGSNGSPITGYTVTASPGGATKSASGTSVLFDELTNGTSYTFSVVATNGIGDSLPSAPSAAVVPATVPGAPTAVEATRGDGSAVVTWVAPAANGEPITGYTVTSSPGGHTGTSTGTSATVEGLTNGTSYVFTVVATNAVGDGPVSEPSGAVVPAGVPGAPTGVIATAGNASAQVSWTAPGNDGGSPISGYTVTASPGGATKSASGTNVLFDGLSNGTAYTFTVAAVNGAGTGLPSAPSSAVTPFTVPAAPTGVGASPGDGQATVGWTAPNNGGSPITGYTVTASPGGATVSVNGSTTMAVVNGLTNGTAYTFTVVAANAAGTGPAGTSNAVTPLTTAGQYVPLAPVRLLDTRHGVGRPGTAKVGPGSTLTLDVTGVGGVPTGGVTSVALNVTVTQPTAGGFLSVYPEGVARPVASNLNFVTGQTVPNMVVVKVGTDGRIRFFNGSAGSSHVLADVVGFFGDASVSGSSYTPLPPSRLMDTRSTSAISSRGTRTLDVTGVGGVPASGVKAVVMNVTVTQPTGGGFLTVYRSGIARPGTSNLNFAKGQTVPNLVVVEVGPDGLVSFFNSNGNTHVFADVVGYFAPGSAASTMTGVTPSRVLDTRSGPAVGPGQSFTLDVTGRGGVPANGVDAVVVNVTVTRPTGTGFLTVYPSDVARPNASNLNFVPGLTVPNLVVVKVGPDGGIKLFNSNGNTDVIVDVVGYFS